MDPGGEPDRAPRAASDFLLHRTFLLATSAGYGPASGWAQPYCKSTVGSCLCGEVEYDDREPSFHGGGRLGGPRPLQKIASVTNRDGANFGERLRVAMAVNDLSVRDVAPRLPEYVLI
jgi:hypothetical protein